MKIREREREKQLETSQTLCKNITHTQIRILEKERKKGEAIGKMKERKKERFVYEEWKSGGKGGEEREKRREASGQSKERKEVEELLRDQSQMVPLATNNNTPYFYLPPPTSFHRHFLLLLLLLSSNLNFARLPF